MLRRLPLRVFRRARCATVRRSCERDPPPAARQRQRRAVQRRELRNPTRSGDDHRPSMYASPAPVSPWSRMRTAPPRRGRGSLPRSSDSASPNSSGSRPAGRPSAGRPGSATRRPAPIRRARAESPARDRPKRPRGGHVPSSCDLRVDHRARATRPCRWNGIPRRHRCRACQWMRAIVLWVMNGWRRSIRTTIRSVSGRRRRTRLVARSGTSPCRSLMRDAQAAGVVVDVDRVAALHVDERRDVERLRHRRARTDRPVAEVAACRDAARGACCGPRRRPRAGRPPRRGRGRSSRG